jgi:hypothetical protein
MNISMRKYCAALLLFITLFSLGRAENQARAADKDGKIVVFVTWGDNDNTPAANVYIEAHGHVQKSSSEKSFVFQMVRAGHYEVSLPPAVYDVFVSEGSSEPRCKRLLVNPGLRTFWNLKLEIDHIYNQK